MLSHQAFVEDLINLVVRRPLITNYMVRNSLNEFIVIVISVFLFLQIWVRIARDTLGVVDLHVGLVGTNAIKRNQIYHGFLPSIWSRKVEILHCLFIVVFNLV